MHTVPLRQAIIQSDFEGRVRVTALGLGDRWPDSGRLAWTVGACHEGWGEASPEALHLGLYRVFAELTEHARVPVAAVHRALLAIPEYRAGLSPDHPDAMGTAERRRLAVMMDLPRQDFPISLFSS